MTEALEKKREPERLDQIDNRYRIEEVIGRGGMGAVYKAYDTLTGRNLALKRLSEKSDPKDFERSVELFEREFYTLSHLSHPRVVEVYDYGKDNLIPYYTMELLGGGDLKELSPLPWRTVCALLCDICSVISLLHSRRLVHRDVTPRNIRCTENQTAKLIDFGAMIPAGPSKFVVGTPYFLAPEVLIGQAVDARTDLFALGATAYYALTGRHANPAARTFAALQDAWRNQPSPPSRYVSELPEKLDQLVMSLIHLNPMARPTSAAEVMERLSAIAGIRLDEQLVVRQSYLSTPNLIGRDDATLRVREQMVRALRHRGGVIFIAGAAGVGRSRVLDTCVLEGRLAGAAVARADAADANAGDWGAVQAIARQLIDAIPHAALKAGAPHAPVLGHILPEIVDRLERDIQRNSHPGIFEAAAVADSDGEMLNRPHSMRPRRGSRDSVALKKFESPQEQRSGIQTALRDWFLEASKYRFIVVAVDDIHRIDEPSAAFVALLAGHATDRRLVVAVTAESDAPATSEQAVSLLGQAGTRIQLRNLSLEETEKLLLSVFGESANVRLVADRLQAISDGNPRAVMQLAQHLLDKGIIRYQAGAWILPSELDPNDLPNSLIDTLRSKLLTLSADALELAQAIALNLGRNLNFNECLALTRHSDKAQLLRDLNTLVAADVLSTDGDIYALRQRSWRPILIDMLDQDRCRALHIKLAELLEKRGTEPFRVTQHLLQADETQRALDFFVAFTARTRERYFENPNEFIEHVQSLPKDWSNTSTALMRACEQLNLPHLQRYLIRTHLISCAGITGECHPTHLTDQIAQMVHDCGLDIYQDLGDSVEPSARLERSLALAQQRYDAAAEFDRVLEPFKAISALAQAIVCAIGGVGNANDYRFLASLPSLQPLFPLSPALGAVQKNLEATVHYAAGRFRQARQAWLEVIERMDQPDRAQFDQSTYTYIRLAIIWAMGVLDAFDGLESSAKWIEELEKDPVFIVNAWRLRALQALNQGDAQRADECKKRVELLQIQNNPSQFAHGAMCWNELLCYAAYDDLVEVKQTFSDIENIAERFAGWVPNLHFARGTYHRIRGDFASALNEYEQALRLTSPGEHNAWAPIAGGRLLTLLGLGKLAEVISLAEEASKAAKQQELEDAIISIGQPLALAEASLGITDRAVEHADAVIAYLQHRGTTGVALGSAYETRARVAIASKNHEDFKTFAQLCADQYKTGHNPLLTAKYEKLMHEARRAGIGVSGDLAHAADIQERDKVTEATVATLLSACEGSRQRAERTLALVAQQSGACGGLLYTMQPGGPALAAQTGDKRAPSQIDALVTAYLSAEIDGISDVTMTEADAAEGTASNSAWMGIDNERFIPVILRHPSTEGLAITALVVLCEDPAKPIAVPYDLLPILSKALFDAGDVVTAIAAQ